MKYILIISVLFFSACAPSVINLNIKKGLSSYEQFGKTGSREFIYNGSISDSIKLIWESEINGSFPNSSITAYDNYIFINDLSGRIYCFDFTNGKRMGLLKFSGAVYTTPVISNTTIIFALAQPDKMRSLLYYYDFNSGKNLYEKEIPGLVLTEIIKVEDGVIFNTENGKVFKYSFSGDMIWEYDTGSPTHCSPALGNKRIIFGNNSGEVIVLNSESGSLILRNKIGDPFFGGAAIDGNRAYIGNDNGFIYAINLMNGNIEWEYDTGFRIKMVPVINHNSIVIGNLKGKIFSLSKDSGELNWKTDTKGVLNSSPLVADNLILISDLNEKYHFIDFFSGEIKKSIELDGRGKLSPVIYNDLLFIGYDNGIIRAYEFVN